jgi:Flp pilus assembly secretin CpaC
VFHHRFLRKRIQKPRFFGKAGLLFAPLLFSALVLPQATPGEDGADTIAKLDHLLQAAVHLENAGRTDLAAEIYAQLATAAEADRQRLAEIKLAQIRQLELEVTRLATPSPCVGQVLIQLKVVELSLEKLAASGLSLVSIRSLLDSNAGSAVPDEGGQISQFLESLRREGLVQVVAEPKLVTVNGRPARLEVGSLAAAGPRAEQPPTDQSVRTIAGLRFACTPKITAPGKLSLELNFRRQASASPAGQGDLLAGPQVAGTLEVSTVVELRSGEPLILAGPRQSGSAQGGNATLLLVTATIVGAQAPLPVP